MTFSTHRGELTGHVLELFPVLNLEDHLGLVISPRPVVTGLRQPAGMPQVTAAQVLHRHTRWDVWVLIVSYRFNIPDRLAVHLSIHARPELRAHRK